MNGSTYILPVLLPKRIPLAGRRALSRGDFFVWLWKEFKTRGLLGIHEGTLLSEDAAREGLETDSWTVDSGEAPRERDWVEGQSLLQAELYFAGRKQAESAAARLEALSLKTGLLREQKNEDWDAQWKASFTGAEIPPHWRILPPWVAEDSTPAGGVATRGAVSGPGARILRINPGAGFGTGTHETTRLCLQAMAETWPRPGGPPGDQAPSASTQPLLRALDFGSGSGILSIAAALLGAYVDGVEIDPLAIENAVENARLNGFVLPSERLRFMQHLPEGPERPEGCGLPELYDLVIANILRPVLLEFSEQLVARLKPGGTLILSGLIASDVPSVVERYSDLLKKKDPQHAHKPARILELNEWRAIVWSA